MSRRILIIEDDPDILTILERTILEMGYQRDYSLEGERGLEMAKAANYDLLLIDVNLPDLNGFRVCEEIRKTKNSVPIIMVTSRTDEEDKIHGLEIGADDYVLKPFSRKELAARINALLRRTGTMNAQDGNTIIIDELVIDTAERIVKLKGEVINLTSLEFDILALLASNPGKLFTRDHLMHVIWGYESPEFGPSITTYLSRLRSKIEADPKEPYYIRTVRGNGYRFAPQAE